MGNTSDVDEEKEEAKKEVEESSKAKKSTKRCKCPLPWNVQS